MSSYKLSFSHARIKAILLNFSPVQLITASASGARKLWETLVHKSSDSFALIFSKNDQRYLLAFASEALTSGLFLNLQYHAYLRLQMHQLWL